VICIILLLIISDSTLILAIKQLMIYVHQKNPVELALQGLINCQSIL